MAGNAYRTIVPIYVLDRAAASPAVQDQIRVAASKTSAKQSFMIANMAEFPAAAPVGTRKYRVVYDAQNSQILEPTAHTQVRDEDSPPAADEATNEAFENAGDVWDFFYQEYQMKSLDNNYMPIRNVVHFDENFVNAFWLPAKQAMYYGDGIEGLMTNFTGCLEVVGHEMAHAVIDKLCPLTYYSQSGALNESVADVFGIMIKQRKLQQDVNTSNWLIGEGIMAPQINGRALRSMADPGKAYDDPALGGRDPQPRHMDNYADVIFDEGGVHINSGIPNHAFYKFAMKLGGYAWRKAGLVWITTLKENKSTRKLHTDSNFLEFANATLEYAEKIDGSALRQVLSEAWSEVGITTERRR